MESNWRFNVWLFPTEVENPNLLARMREPFEGLFLSDLDGPFITRVFEQLAADTPLRFKFAVPRLLPHFPYGYDVYPD